MNWRNRRLLDLFGFEHPILLAPMAGATNVDMVVRMNQAGGLGGLGAAGIKPDALRSMVRQINAASDRPYQVNVFAAETEQWSDASIGPKFRNKLEGYHAELALGAVPEPSLLFGPVADQLAVLLEEQVPVISFHFGVDAETVAKIHQAGSRVLCSATTVDEARVLADRGVDAIIAQGSEAGGHRGTFLGNYQQALIGTMALVPQIVDAVKIPVIAAGGIMDARGVVAALALGASAAQMGTAFLGCREAPIAGVWREKLMSSQADDLVVTKALSGKPARGLRNRYIDEIDALNETLLPYPLQYSVTQALRREAQLQDNPDFLAMWAGQGIGMLQENDIASLMAALVTESETIIQRL
ncbi:MAG: nitronate monooxygenase [Urechidicola sp.]|jgi:nitronate monooxygenase